MPPHTASSARTSVRSRKSSGKVADSDGVQVTPPMLPVKREAPVDTPAIQMRAPPPTPVISRQLSFGTINSEGIDPSLNEANPSQNKVKTLQASSPQKILSRAPKLVSAAAGDEQSTAVTPVKKGKRKSTLKASKKAVLSPKEAKWQRQANPAKRLRPIACLDSDSDDVVVVGETQLMSSSAGSLGESDLSDDDLDKLWLDTPKSSLISKSLVLSMLDVEAEEADEGDDEMEQDEQEDQKEDEQEDTDSVVSACEDSPLPVTAKTNCHKPQAKGKVKGKAKAKAPSKRVEAPPASASQQPSSSSASSDPLANIPPSIFAWEMGSLADIFGSPVDNPISGDLYVTVCAFFDNPLNPDSQSNGSHAVTGHVKLLDKAVFTAIPPILYDIVAYLQSSGIVNHLHFSELLPGCTACDEPGGYMPKLMEVLSRMSNDPIIDCLLFRGYGVYVNPLTTDPAEFRIINKKIMFKPGVKHLLYPIFIMPVVVQQCDLLALTCTSERFQEEHLCLTGWVFDEVFALFFTFFTSRPAKVEAASAPSTPQKSAQHSLAFGRPSLRTGNNQVRQSAPRVALQFSHLRHPHSLGLEDTIPIYDGRSRYGNFRTKDRDWETIANLPRLGVPPSLPRRQPDYSQTTAVQSRSCLLSPQSSVSHCSQISWGPGSRCCNPTQLLSRGFPLFALPLPPKQMLWQMLLLNSLKVAE
ncbi:hypothetical protein BDN71DRAFT_1432966 [Pleurotus eryngii]|uniref:Uncharacterized protein n=1 Tax=Pleurotus eryngii TaxID=5323 RepID=A0A9P6D6C1_PLEER|nr:hypothetical protein BDN71DRAFT_1432966 [Pleurotus eryngii]